MSERVNFALQPGVIIFLISIFVLVNVLVVAALYPYFSSGSSGEEEATADTASQKPFSDEEDALAPALAEEPSREKASEVVGETREASYEDDVSSAKIGREEASEERSEVPKTQEFSYEDHELGTPGPGEGGDHTEESSGSSSSLEQETSNASSSESEPESGREHLEERADELLSEIEGK